MKMIPFDEMDFITPDMTPIDFLQHFYDCYDDSFDVTYYVAGKGVGLIKGDSIDKVAKEIEEDISYFEGCGLKEKAKEVAFYMWSKKLVKFT